MPDPALAVPAHAIEMPPAVALAEPQKLSPVVDPLELVLKIDPGVVVILEDRAWPEWLLVLRMTVWSTEAFGCAGGMLCQHDANGVLVPIELLEDQLVAVARPTRDRRCNCRGDRRARRSTRVSPPLGRDDAYPASGVLLADLGVLDVGDPRIQAVGVVDQRKLRNTPRVQLPVRDPLPVRAESKSVAQTELFFINPIECAVDFIDRARIRQLGDPAVDQVFDVDVVLAHISHLRAARGELGVHERARRSVSAQLVQLAGGPVEHPVVASRVGSPDAFGVGENEQPRSIARERVILDRKRRRFPGRDQVGRGNQHALLARSPDRG